MSQQTRDDVGRLQAQVEVLERAVAFLLSKISQADFDEFNGSASLGWVQGTPAAEGAPRPQSYIDERKTALQRLIALAASRN